MKKKFHKKPKNKKIHGDLANSLIEIAVHYIGKEKSTEFALRELAKKLGVSHAAAYKHFRSKQDLLESIAIRGFEMLSKNFKSTLLLSKKNNQKEPIVLLGEAYIEFGLQNPGYYRVMFGVDYGSELNEELRKSCYESFYILLDTIGQRSTENATKAFYSWSLVHGFVMLNLDGQIQGPMNEFKIVTRPALFSDLIHHLVSMK